MPAREVEDDEDDEDGDALSQHAVAHQPVRPFALYIATDPECREPRRENQHHRDERDRDNEQTAGGHPGLTIPRCWPSTPTVRPALWRGLSAGARSRCRRANVRTPCGRRAAAG